MNKAGEWVEKSKQLAGKIPPGKGGSPGQPYDAPKEDPKNPYVPAPPRPKLVHAIPGEHGHPGGRGFPNEQVPQRQDLIINEGDSTEGVDFPMPIRGGREGKEEPMITPQTTPNTPHPGELAQVNYTSPNPKFDEHMKSTPPLTKPKERIDHLKKGVNIHKA